MSPATHLLGAALFDPLPPSTVQLFAYAALLVATLPLQTDPGPRLELPQRARYEAGGGLLSRDRVWLDESWSASVRVVDGSVDVVWGEEGALDGRHAALSLEGTGLDELFSAGGVGGGRVLVGGATAEGVGRLAVFDFTLEGERPVSSLRGVLDFGTAFAGALDGMRPIGMATRHGAPDHAMVFMAPGGQLVDLDLAAALGGESAGATPRVVLTADEGFERGGAWETLRTELSRTGGAAYVFCEDPGGCGVLSSRTFVDAWLDGQLESRSQRSPDGSFVSWDPNGFPRDEPLLVRRGEPLAPRFEGLPSASAQIRNVDVLAAASGAVARIERVEGAEGGPTMPRRSLALNWSLGDLSARQVIELPAPIVTWAPLGGGRLAVQTHAPTAGVGRLELYQLQGPTWSDAGGPVFSKPEHLRTLHAAADYAGESPIAIFANRAKPSRAFVLLRESSCLCSVDLTATLQTLAPVLTTAEQPVLAERINEVESFELRGLGPGYRLMDVDHSAFWDERLAMRLGLLDKDADGELDGPGYTLANEAYWVDLLEQISDEGTPYSVYRGQPVE